MAALPYTEQLSTYLEAQLAQLFPGYQFEVFTWEESLAQWFDREGAKLYVPSH